MTYIENFLDKVKDININYIQIYKNGEKIEEYDRVGTKTRLHVYSVSKSITSLGVGIAIDEGLIKLDDLAYKYFDEINFDDCDPLIKNIRIKDLLTMSCGVGEKLFFADEEGRYITKDWLKYFFSKKFLYEPGTHFEYCNFNSYLLSCIVEKASGLTLLEYMKPRFFEPLGIGNPDWLSCPKGHTYGAFGLMLTIDEMSKIGLLLLNKGIYDGKKIVSSDYIAKASVNHIEKDMPKFGYGYQFWINEDLESYRADGKYGQYIVVVPNSNLVVTMQSLEGKKFYPDVWKYLIKPIIEGE